MYNYTFCEECDKYECMPYGKGYIIVACQYVSDPEI